MRAEIVPVGGGAVELRAGVSAVFGAPEQGGLGKKLEMVPSFRYTHVWRGEDALYVGLGDPILRMGVGVRLWTSH